MLWERWGDHLPRCQRLCLETSLVRVIGPVCPWTRTQRGSGSWSVEWCNSGDIGSLSFWELLRGGNPHPPCDRWQHSLFKHREVKMFKPDNLCTSKWKAMLLPQRNEQQEVCRLLQTFISSFLHFTEGVGVGCGCSVGDGVGEGYGWGLWCYQRNLLRAFLSFVLSKLTIVSSLSPLCWLGRIKLDVTF